MQSQERTKGLDVGLLLKNRGWKEEVKPRTDKRPIKYEGCLMCIYICYVHTDTILDFSHCTFMTNTQSCTWRTRHRVGLPRSNANHIHTCS